MYRSMDDQVVLEVGKITMGRAALEGTVYDVAEDLALGIDRSIREMSGTQAAQEIRAKVLDAGLPPWVGADVTPEVLADWASEAKGALKDGHKIVHSHSFQTYGEGEQWTPVRRQTGVNRAETPTDLEKLRRLRERIDGLDVRGGQLRIGIVPMAARGLYTPYYTADRGSIISHYEGGWYRLPGTREEAYDLARRTHEWCTSILNGHPTPVLVVDSPHGERPVPPWFVESERGQGETIDS